MTSQNVKPLEMLNHDQREVIKTSLEAREHIKLKDQIGHEQSQHAF